MKSDSFEMLIHFCIGGILMLLIISTYLDYKSRKSIKYKTTFIIFILVYILFLFGI